MLFLLVFYKLARRTNTSKCKKFKKKFIDDLNKLIKLTGKRDFSPYELLKSEG